MTIIPTFLSWSFTCKMTESNTTDYNIKIEWFIWASECGTLRFSFVHETDLNFILGSRSETRQNMHMTDRRSLDVPRSRRNSQSDTDDKSFRKPAATLSMHLKKITLKPTRIGLIDKKETSIVKRTRRCSTYCTILTLHQSRLNSDGIETRHSLKFTAGLTDQFLVIKHKLSRRTYDKRVRKTRYIHHTSAENTSNSDEMR